MARKSRALADAVALSMHLLVSAGVLVVVSRVCGGGGLFRVGVAQRSSSESRATRSTRSSASCRVRSARTRSSAALCDGDGDRESGGATAGERGRGSEASAAASPAPAGAVGGGGGGGGHCDCEPAAASAADRNDDDDVLAVDWASAASFGVVHLESSLEARALTSELCDRSRLVARREIERASDRSACIRREVGSSVRERSTFAMSATNASTAGSWIRSREQISLCSRVCTSAKS